MTDVRIEWDDNVHTIQGAFDSTEDFNQLQLDEQITAMPATIQESMYSDHAWSGYYADTLYYRIDGPWSAQRQSSIEAVVAAHIPVEYEMRKIVELTAVTNGSGVATFNFAKPYKTVPRIHSETPSQGQQFHRRASVTTTGCAIGVTSSSTVSVLSVNVLGATTNVSGAEVNIMVINRDVEE